MSFQSKDQKILKQQLQVQEVLVRFEDLGLYTASGSTITVDLGEASTVTAVIDLDNSSASIANLAASAIVVSGTSVTLTMSDAFASNDKVIIKYIVTE